jgi:C1A family cysteine protease
VIIGNYSISDLPAVWFDGFYRVLGCLPSTPESIAQFPKWNETRGLTATSLQEIDMSWYKPPILNQGMTSSCVGHGTCSGMEMCWLQAGKPLEQFNPYFVYGLVNNGVDKGASISDALTALQTYGVCPLGDLQPGVMFKSQFPQQSFTDAKRFVLQEAYHCSSFQEICQAISNGFVVPLGLYVGSNFGQLDSNGISPLPAGGGGGHCVLGVGLKQSSQYGWLIKIQNSWGANFGMSGYSYLREQSLQYMQPDAFAIQTVSDDPQGTPGDDPVVTS